MEFFTKIVTNKMLYLIVILNLFIYVSCEPTQDLDILHLDKINDLNSWFVCPEGWLLSSNSSKCLRVFNSDQTWIESRDFCRSFGGDLASLHSETDFVVVKSLVSEDTWIGLNDIDTEGVYVWSDSSAVDFTSWALGEPDSKNGTASCAFLNEAVNFNFTDDDCSASRRFICENKRDEELPVYRCPQSWIMNSNSNKCFHVINIPHSWQDSLNLCREFGGDLASLLSESDFILAKSLVSADTWIGLNDLDTKGVYEWTDNSTVDYTRWAPGQPDNTDDIQNCVDLRYEWDFQFDDDYCNEEESFLCEKTPDAIYRCPVGWSPTADSSKCFRLITGHRSWGSSLNLCREFGGDLVSIHSDADYELAKSLVSETTWIGLNDIDHEGTFVWSDSSPVDYTSWNPGEPNNDGKHDGEDCCELQASSYGFNDHECDSSESALCQIINKVV